MKETLSGRVYFERNGGGGMSDFDEEIADAEKKAIESLARYKFAMFGYWAGIWVHLNRISGDRRPNPFKKFVDLARMTKEVEG